MPQPRAPDQGFPVTEKRIDLSAEIIKSYGPKWNEPEIQYVFSNGRKIKMRTKEDIYDV